jgi:cobalt/nickel transport system permease protein
MGALPKSLKDLVDGAESLVYVEDMCNRRGLLQSINPLAKLVVTIIMIVASLFVSSLFDLAVLCFIPLIMVFASRIPLKGFVTKTSFFIPAFAALISVPTLFLTQGKPLLSVDLGAFGLSITLEGLQRFLEFTIRVWFCVACLTVLTLSTGIDRILKLLSSLKVPAIIVQLFSLTYRYFFVSVEQVQKVLMAKEARTYVNKRTVSLRELRALGTILATLFMRVYERSERVYMAMKARGFELNKSNKTSVPAMRSRDFLFAALTIIPLVLLATF